MPTVLITGANRGIGLELARQYVEDGWTVYAGCRNPEKADALQKLTWAVGDHCQHLASRAICLSDQQGGAQYAGPGHR